jgi:hypothetical protein
MANQHFRSRAVAHWIATLLLVPLGIACLFTGIRAFFVGASNMTLLDFVLLLLATLALLSVLPIGLVSVFKPRFAAHALAGSWLVLMLSAYGSIRWSEVDPSLSASDFVRPLILWFALPIGLVALLLYASPLGAPVEAQVSGQPPQATRERAGAGAPAERDSALESASRKRMAKWVALILGVALGLWRFQWAWHSTVHAPQIVLWMAACNATPWLVAAPLALLGIWKPRWAAYAFGACFLAPLVSQLLPMHSLGDAFGYLPFTGLQALPFALVAALFFYASRPGGSGLVHP